LEALGDLDGCMFLPGDQPLLRRETVAKLIQCWESNREQILRPVCGDVPGSPVLFPRWAFPELMNLPEGKGGNCVIKNYPDRVTTVNIADSYELMDADTPETLQLLQQVSKSRRG
jgi:molybdenum cofactor cytidylyltransferase